MATVRISSNWGHIEGFIVVEGSRFEWFLDR
jgi:hypothetical protein